jgi:phosphatidylinositol alpha-mannosyltransferase
MCAVSPPAADFARRVFGLECRVIPAMVDVSGIARASRGGRKKPARDRTIVTFLGRLVKRKGSLELVEALALIPAALRERVDVRVAGRGPLAEEVRHKVDVLGLSGVVTMPGFVSEEDKPRFLGEADVAVFPATGGESFGIVLIEAMAAGAGVVIGGDNPGYMSVLGDHPDVTFNPRDAEAFAALLTRLVAEPDHRATLHALQQERVRQYDVAAVGAAIEALYRGDPP